MITNLKKDNMADNEPDDKTNQVDGDTDNLIESIESAYGDDIIPYLIIMLVKVTVKHDININWVCNSIQIGYYNRYGPTHFNDKYDEKGNVIYDS